MCGGESGNASETSVKKPTSTRCRKCKAHLSKSEQAKLEAAGHTIAEGSERADELAKEGARDDISQWILYDTYKAAVETSRAIISYIGNSIFRAKGGERWPDVVAPPQEWGEKNERRKHVVPILARPHKLMQRKACTACGRYASEGAAMAKLARTERVEHPAATLGEQARPQCHLLAQTGRLVWCCSCRAKAAKFAKKLGEPRVGQQNSQKKKATSIRLLSSGWHPKENRFLTSPKLFTEQAWMKCRQSYQGENCDTPGLTELKQAVDRLPMAEAQPTDPAGKKHLLLEQAKSSGAGVVVRALRETLRRECC